MATRSNELERLIRQRVENVFATRQLECAEAVLSVINRAFRGDLPDALAVRLASGFPEGLGGSGCLCGALSGAVMAMGLFLGRSGPGVGNGRVVKRAVAELQQAFKAIYASTCCRMLTKDLAYGRRAHLDQCVRISGETARLAAGILINTRPGLMAQVDWDYLNRRDSAPAAGLRIVSGAWRQTMRLR